MSTERARSGPVDRRRLLIGGGIGLLAATGIARLPTGSAWAASGASGTPATLSAVRTVTGATAVTGTPFPLTHLGLDWAGPAAPAVRLRTAAGWSSWTVASHCSGGRDGHPPRSTALLPAAGVVGYEIETTDAVVLGEFNCVDGPRRPTAAGAHSLPELYGRRVPLFRNRASWGADESLRFDEAGVNRFPDAFFPVQTITVHHTATDVDDDPAVTMRSIYANHTLTRDFGDIGYHLLIDPDGTVHEGRASGEDRFPVFGGAPGPDRRPQMNNGAHVGGFNAGNIGVALLGDFTAQPPTRAAVDTLVVVLALLTRLCELDPLGTTDYVNPISGATRRVDTIAAHRDWAATECPGDTLFPRLADLRERVAAARVEPSRRG